MGYDKSLLFLTGYAIEKSLSVDNMFVFVLIFSSLGIPYIYQHKVLMLGILSAIGLRIVLILAGISLLESFHWMIYIFGGLLIFTAIRMLVAKKEKKIEIEKNIAVRILKKFVPIELKGDTSDKFLHRASDGIMYATPMLIALVIIEMTDLVFALDSIPAILAITTDSFLVITSNIFAILGLRSLYFLLAGMIDKFYYLKPGLAAILLFIGIKMLISEVYEIPIPTSIAINFGILGLAIMLSFIRIKYVSAKEDRDGRPDGEVSFNKKDTDENRTNKFSD
jgi:tellurite resistance protein TerC